MASGIFQLTDLSDYTHVSPAQPYMSYARVNAARRSTLPPQVLYIA